MTKGAKLLEKEVVKDTGGKVSVSINLIEFQNLTIRHYVCIQTLLTLNIRIYIKPFILNILLIILDLDHSSGTTTISGIPNKKN